MASITTKIKHIGLEPEYIKEGDFVVILYGMQLPLISLETNNEDTYTFVGKACNSP